MLSVRLPVLDLHGKKMPSFSSDAIPRAAFTAPGLSKKKSVGPPILTRVSAVPHQSTAVLTITVGSPIEEILDIWRNQRTNLSKITRRNILTSWG